MKEISKKEASKKYGICVSGPNSLNRYYLREDGCVVDDTDCVRYYPPKKCENCGRVGTEQCRTCTIEIKNGIKISGPSNWVEKKKPSICNILGVEVGESFYIKGIKARFWIQCDGTFCTAPSNVTGSTRALLLALENPTLIQKYPELSMDELALCRQLYNAGARWLARGKHLRWYKKKPFLREEDGKWDMTGDWNGDTGRLPYGLLSFIQPKQAVALHTLIGKDKE